jgi:hypothetical protein
VRHTLQLVVEVQLQAGRDKRYVQKSAQLSNSWHQPHALPM